MGRLVEEQAIGATRQLLFALAAEPAVRRGTPKAADAAFATTIKAFPRYANIGLIDRNGKVTASGLSMEGPVDLSDRRYFQETLARKRPVVGGFIIGRITGKPSIIVSQPIVDAAGAVRRVLFAAIGLRWLNDNEKGFVALLPKGSIYLETDGSGRIIVDPTDPRELGKAPPGPLSAMTRSRGGIVRALRLFDGVVRDFAVVHLRESRSGGGERAVILGVPQQRLFGIADNFLTLASIGLVLAFCLGLFITWIGVGRLVIRPVRAMLSETEERYRRLVEEANDGVMENDAEGRIVFANRRMGEILGRRPADLVGRNFVDFVAGEERDDHLDRRSRRRHGKREQYERSLLRKDGTRVEVLLSSSARFSPGGKYLGFFAILTDVTTRKEMERRLRESEERFRAFVTRSPEAFFFTDEEGRYIEFNPAAEELTGVSAEWVIGRYAWELPQRILPPERRTAQHEELLRSRILDSLRSEQMSFSRTPIEGSLVRPDGELRRFEMTLFPIESDRGRRIAGVAVDVTARFEIAERYRQSQEQLMQAQKMEAVGRLAGGIAHDFNNILTAIMGFASILTMRLEGNQELQRHVAKIMASSRRAAELVQGLLTFSRRQPSSPAVVELRAALNRQRTMLERMVGEDVKVRLRLHGPAAVRIDAGELDQIMMNLATNARDAMPDGGTLTIEVIRERVHSPPVREMAPGSYVAIIFSDSGVGMSEAVRAQIFEPFFTTKETGRGTGLGLSIVWSIAEQRGGAVTVESEVGRGTSVHLYLPEAKGEVDESAELEELGSVEGSEGILVVEDDPALRDLLRSILSENGYTVYSASSGEEALQRIELAGERIRLVLLDIVLPKMSGPDVAAEIRSRLPLARFVYMSGYASETLMQKGAASLEDPVIRKPFSPLQLAEMVRHALDA